MNLAEDVLTAEQRIQKAHIAIMRHPNYIFLTNVLMLGLVKVIDDDTLTACTDGKNVLYGRKFVDSLTDAELIFLVLHENFHKMYKHLRTWRHLSDENPKIANMATDYVINLQIHKAHELDQFAVMPEGGCLDKRFAGMNAGEVFAIIKEEMEEGEDGEDGEDGEGGQGGQSGNGGDYGTPLDEHDWEGADEMTDDEKQKLSDDIDNALRQGTVLAGTQGGNVSGEITELLKPKIDWRKMLRHFVQELCKGSDYGTYAKPNRRFIGSDVYLPSPVSETIPELVIGMDTSGSCWEALPYFLAELHSICKTIKALKVHIMFWDTEVEYKLVEGADVENVEIKHAYGGGGTDVNCVTKFMNDEGIKPTAAVILTDGYLSDGWGSWSCPVMWALVNNDRDVPTTGKYVRVEDWKS